MKSNVLLKIAKTHLLARLKQTSIAALGVTFGIGTFIILVSFMTGLNGLLDGLILNRTPHIRIYNEVQPTAIQPVQKKFGSDTGLYLIHSVKPKYSKARVKNFKALTTHLVKDKRVKGVTPQVSARVFYQSGAIQLNGSINGINVLKESELFNFQDYIIQGKPQDLENNQNGIILGIGVAEKLALKIGEYIQVLSSSGVTVRLKIVGFYQSGLSDIDKIQSYVNLKTAQKLNAETGGYVTDIHVKLFDITKAPSMTIELKNSFGVNAVDIQTANAQFETGTSIRNLITYAVSITLLIVAGFGIYNILNMLIYEKMNDIAILKATGFSGPDVMRIFIYQALMIGVVGGVIGLIFGYFVSVLISHTPFETQALPTVKTFPVNFNGLYYVIGTVFAIITTFFAGYMPARRASKIDPVEIIRGQ